MPTPLEAIADLLRACQPLPSVVTAGQPTERHLEALKEAGVQIVVDLRDPMEPRPFDEPVVVSRMGMEYVNVPLSTGTLADDTVERILGVLRRAGNRTLFLHCNSGGRAGGALLPYLMLDVGLPEEAAVTEAMRVGLRSVEYLEWGLDYVRRQQQRKGSEPAAPAATQPPSAADDTPLEASLRVLP